MLSHCILTVSLRHVCIPSAYCAYGTIWSAPSVPSPATYTASNCILVVSVVSTTFNVNIPERATLYVYVIAWSCDAPLRKVRVILSNIICMDFPFNVPDSVT